MCVDDVIKVSTLRFTNRQAWEPTSRCMGDYDLVISYQQSEPMELVNECRVRTGGRASSAHNIRVPRSEMNVSPEELTRAGSATSQSQQRYFDGLTFEQIANDPNETSFERSSHKSGTPVKMHGTDIKMTEALHTSMNTYLCGDQTNYPDTMHTTRKLNSLLENMKVENESNIDRFSSADNIRPCYYIGTVTKKECESLEPQDETQPIHVTPTFSRALSETKERSPFPPFVPNSLPFDRRVISECLFKEPDLAVQVKRNSRAASEPDAQKSDIRSVHPLPPLNQLNGHPGHPYTRRENYKTESAKKSLHQKSTYISEKYINSRPIPVLYEPPVKEIVISKVSSLAKSNGSPLLPMGQTESRPPFIRIKANVEDEFMLFIPPPPPLPKIPTSHGYPVIQLRILSNGFNGDMLRQILEVKGKLQHYIPQPPPLPSAPLKPGFPVIKLKTIGATQQNKSTYREKLLEVKQMLKCHIPKAPTLPHRLFRPEWPAMEQKVVYNEEPSKTALCYQLMMAKQKLGPYIPQPPPLPLPLCARNSVVPSTRKFESQYELPNGTLASLQEQLQQVNENIQTCTPQALFVSSNVPAVRLTDRTLYSMGSQSQNRLSNHKDLVPDVSIQFDTSSFLSLPVTELCELLSDNHLDVISELQVARAGIHWIDYIYNVRQVWTTSVMSCVRFAYMTHEDIDILGGVSPNILDNKHLQICLQNAHWQVMCMSDKASSCLRTQLKLPQPRIKGSGKTISIPEDSPGVVLQPGVTKEMNTDMSKSTPSRVHHVQSSSSDISTGSQWSTVSEESSMAPKMVYPKITMDLKVASPAVKDIPRFPTMLIPCTGTGFLHPSGDGIIQMKTEVSPSSSQTSTSSTLHSDGEEFKILNAVWSSSSNISTDSQWSTVSNGSSLKSSLVSSGVTPNLPVDHMQFKSPAKDSFDPKSFTLKKNNDSCLLPEPSTKQQNTIYIIGSTDEASFLLEFDTKENTWRIEQLMANAVLNNKATYLDNYIYMSGGSNAHMWHNSKMKASRDVKRYDRIRKKWSSVTPMHRPRSHHGLVALYGKLIAIGGQDNEEKILDSVECYNPATDTWAYLPPLNMARMGAAVTLFQGHVVVAGGYGGRLKTDDSQLSLLDSVECFNPVDNRWTELNPMQGPRCFASLTTCRERMFLSGGMIYNPFGPRQWCSLGSVEVYDVGSDTWKGECRFAVPRHNFATFAEEGKIYFIGGSIIEFDAVVPTVECYDTVNRVWDMDCENMPYALTGPMSIVCPKI